MVCATGLKGWVVALAAVVVLGSTAQGAMISAYYTYDYWQGTSFSTRLPGHTGSMNQTTVQFLGSRVDLPAGPGVDTLIPASFTSYCAEIGEVLQLSKVNHHAEVLPLLGATTTSGGISGPVTFDATRTAHLERLWGAFFDDVVDKNTSAAFQLAQWELAFDTNATLYDQGGTSRFYVGQSQWGQIASIAESWLTAVRGSELLPTTHLYLLKGQGVQDQITGIPEPATLLLLVAAGVPLALRRYRRD